MIGFALVQSPSQAIGASKDVDIPGRLQAAVLAVNAVGSEHEPVGG